MSQTKREVTVFAHDIALLVALSVSGAALMAAIMHFTWVKVTIAVCAAAIGIGLRPKHWLRGVVFVLFIAGTLGLLIIGSDYLKDLALEAPLRHSNTEYGAMAFVYAMFLAAWLCWEFWSRSRSKG